MRILMAQGESLSAAAFARAYAQALNPEIELSLIVPLLCTVFEIDDPDQLSSELSEMGVELLAEDYEVAGDVGSEAISNLGAQDETPDLEHCEYGDSALPGEPNQSGESPSPTGAAAATHSSGDASVTDTGQHTPGRATGDGEGESKPAGSGHQSGDAFDEPDDDGNDEGVSVQGEDREISTGGQRRNAPWKEPHGDGLRGSGQRRTGSRKSGRRAAGDTGTEGGEPSGSPYQASQNWFRVRAARNRAERDEDESSRRRSEAYDDTRARDAVIAFEREGRGWEAVPAPKMQKGYDVISTDPKTGAKRRIEVKGTSSSWTDDATVRLSYSQFHDAHDFEAPNEDYWLYVVDRLGTDRPRVFPIKNPAKSTYWFYLQAQDWADDASTLGSSGVDAEATGPLEDSAEEADTQYLRECIPESLHAVLDSLEGHPSPIPQFELEQNGRILVVDLAWPEKRVGIVDELPDRDLPHGWRLLEAKQIDAREWGAELDRLLGEGGS